MFLCGTRDRKENSIWQSKADTGWFCPTQHLFRTRRYLRGVSRLLLLFSSTHLNPQKNSSAWEPHELYSQGIAGPLSWVVFRAEHSCASDAWFSAVSEGLSTSSARRAIGLSFIYALAEEHVLGWARPLSQAFIRPSLSLLSSDAHPTKIFTAQIFLTYLLCDNGDTQFSR